MQRKQAKDFSDKEIDRRMDKALKGALSLPHKPHEKKLKRVVKGAPKSKRISKRVIPL